MVDLNFTSVVPDQCSYPDDYYQWFPTDEVISTAGLNVGYSWTGMWAVLDWDVGCSWTGMWAVAGRVESRLYLYWSLGYITAYHSLYLFPSQRPGSRCLLGEKITYERRDSDVCCFVDPEYDKPTNRTPCVCAIEDFEWWVMIPCKHPWGFTVMLA